MFATSNHMNLGNDWLKRKMKALAQLGYNFEAPEDKVSYSNITILKLKLN